MAAFIVASEVRDYLGISKSEGQNSDAVIGSNIRAASDYLQRKTGRQFEALTGETKTFTTFGRASIIIPDLRTATTVTKDSAALVADQSYHLIPDRMTTGIFTGIQFRVPVPQSGSAGYLGNPEWWDRGLDWERSYRFTSQPNDLDILGDWGYTSLPDELLFATKILASFYTKRPDSVLASVQVTPEGALLSYRSLPEEVVQFIEEWRLGEQAVAV